MLSGTPNSSVWGQIPLWARKSDRGSTTSVPSAFRRLSEQGGGTARCLHGTSPGRGPRACWPKRFREKHFVARDLAPPASERRHRLRQTLVQGSGSIRKDRNRDENVARPRNEYRSAESVVLPQPGSAHRYAT